jgi:hypothetical protein
VAATAIATLPELQQQGSTIPTIPFPLELRRLQEIFSGDYQLFCAFFS